MSSKSKGQNAEDCRLFRIVSHCRKHCESCWNRIDHLDHQAEYEAVRSRRVCSTISLTQLYMCSRSSYCCLQSTAWPKSWGFSVLGADTVMKATKMAQPGTRSRCSSRCHWAPYESNRQPLACEAVGKLVQGRFSKFFLLSDTALRHQDRSIKNLN